jgi:hypothetical protein
LVLYAVDQSWSAWLPVDKDPGVAPTVTIGGLAGSTTQALDVPDGSAQKLITSAWGRRPRDQGPPGEGLPDVLADRRSMSRSQDSGPRQPTGGDGR